MSNNRELFVLSSVLLLACFITYWVITKSPKFINLITFSSQKSVIRVVGRRVTGWFLMGVVPMIILIAIGQDLTNWGFNLNNAYISLKWIFFLLPVLLILSYFASKDPQNLSMYPEIRSKNWTTSTFVIEYSSWGLYLLGYEFLFRGVFLFGSLKQMGEVEAILLNSVAYSLAHLPKGRRETIGSIFIGLGMAYMTIWTQSIFFSFIFHLIMSWSNSFFSFRLNPEMTYEGRR